MVFRFDKRNPTYDKRNNHFRNLIRNCIHRNCIHRIGEQDTMKFNLLMLIILLLTVYLLSLL